MAKIALVDDHEIFLKGLEGILAQFFEISATFQNGKDLLANLNLLEVDVLVLDVQLPDIKADGLLKQIRAVRPDLPILYLTLLRGNRYFNKLKRFNIQGYVLKDSSIDTLKEAIETVAAGQLFFPERYGNVNEINSVTIPKTRVLSLLSKRERQVFELVVQELSSYQIAEELFISVSTVDSHRKNIMIKLGVDNVVGLIKIAAKSGLT